jgi:hypothetical protein
MSRQVINATTLREVKRRARKLTRNVSEKSYMQYLDQVAQDYLGVRHYHEARVRSKPSVIARPETEEAVTTNTPMAFYLRSCQEYYLDL